MADGRQAARSILAFLKGEKEIEEERELSPLPVLEEEVAEKVKSLPRQESVLAPLQERRTTMVMVEQCFSSEQAAAETRRCLGCGAGAVRLESYCADCLTCLRTCPYGVPTLEDGQLVIRTEQCQACGLCLPICPAMAIQFSSPYVKQAEETLEKVLQRFAEVNPPKCLVLTCGYGGFGSLREEQLPPDTVLARFPCLAKVDTLHMLDAFLAGAESVLLVGCKGEEECQYQDVFPWAEKRVGRVRSILEQVGIPPAKLGLVFLSQPEIENLPEFVSQWQAEEKAQ